jgi:ribosomal protein S18 acetylase RimI-like enzyme
MPPQDESMPMAAELRIAPARREDLDAIAALHARAFPDAAMTAFGPEALRRYYQWLLEGPHDAAVMLAWRDDRLVGFCAAGWFRGAVRGFLRANRLYLAGRVLRHPSLLLTDLVRERIALAVRVTLRFSRLGRMRPSHAAVPQDVRRFGVLAIASDPDARTGAGRALMIEAEARARRDGHASMVLTVHPGNARAVRFYEQLGWERRVGTDGRWTGNMEKRLT